MALFLRKHGYEAYAIRGGLEAWHDAGYPIEEKVGKESQSEQNDLDREEEGRDA